MSATREAMYAQVTIKNVTATPNPRARPRSTRKRLYETSNVRLWLVVRHKNDTHDGVLHDTTSDASRPVIRWKTRSKSS